MIRGAFVLAIGFGLGYSKGMADSGSLERMFSRFMDEVRDDRLAKDGVIDGTATETTTETSDTDNPDKQDQGETPS